MQMGAQKGGVAYEPSSLAPTSAREVMVGYLRRVDESLAQRVANGLSMDTLPLEAAISVPAQDRPNSSALQIIGKMKDTLE